MLPTNELADAIDPFDRLFQALQPPPLLEVTLLQHGDALLQLGARAALRRHHLVRLAEQLRRQLLELAVGAGQGRFGGEAEALFIGDFGTQRLGD
jgi:hypothetical protein